MTEPKRYGNGDWTGDQLRHMIRHEFLQSHDALSAIPDLLDTIDELAATLAGALDVLGPEVPMERVIALKVRAQKLIDEVTQ